jgi:large subunit ribosomal protein L7A
MNSPFLMNNLVVGIRQTIKAVESGKVYRVYIAKDSEPRIIENLLELCVEKGVEVIFLNSMAELGKAARIERGASAVGVLE